MPTSILYLVLTVLFETFGTACIQASQQFTRPWPSLGVVLGYGLSFWFLSLALRTVPLVRMVRPLGPGADGRVAVRGRRRR